MWALRWLAGRPPDEVRSVANRFRLAIAYYQTGQLDSTRRLLEALAAERVLGARDSSMRWFSAITGAPPDHLTFLGFLGVVAAREGKRDEALRFDRTLQAMSPRYLYGRHTMWRARIHALVGERDAAGAPARGAASHG